MLDAGAKSRARAFDATPQLKKDDVMTSGKHPVNEVGEHGHCGHDGADGSEHERNQWPTLGVVCHGWSLLVFPLSGRRPRCSFLDPRSAQILKPFTLSVAGTKASSSGTGNSE